MSEMSAYDHHTFGSKVCVLLLLSDSVNRFVLGDKQLAAPWGLEVVATSR